MINLNQILIEIRDLVKTKNKTNFVALSLFGSFAKGTQTKKSDVDLLFVFKKLPSTMPERLKLVSDILDDIEFETNLEINPIFVEEKKLNKSPILCEIAINGKIIYEEKNILTKFFNKINNEIKIGSIKKIITKNHYFLQIC
ncbi:MAG: nucleotidyltransferase domain-containing protein [Nanoarchaeota archaeon]